MALSDSPMVNSSTNSQRNGTGCSQLHRSSVGPSPPPLVTAPPYRHAKASGQGNDRFELANAPVADAGTGG
jgi:hypothetical protein